VLATGGLRTGGAAPRRAVREGRPAACRQAWFRVSRVCLSLEERPDFYGASHLGCRDPGREFDRGVDVVGLIAQVAGERVVDIYERPVGSDWLAVLDTYRDRLLRGLELWGGRDPGRLGDGLIAGTGRAGLPTGASTGMLRRGSRPRRPSSDTPVSEQELDLGHSPRPPGVTEFGADCRFRGSPFVLRRPYTPCRRYPRLQE
jgi:hypothetical protein